MHIYAYLCISMHILYDKYSYILFLNYFLIFLFLEHFAQYSVKLYFVDDSSINKYSTSFVRYFDVTFVVSGVRRKYDTTKRGDSQLCASSAAGCHDDYVADNSQQQDATKRGKSWIGDNLINFEIILTSVIVKVFKTAIHNLVVSVV